MKELLKREKCKICCFFLFTESHSKTLIDNNYIKSNDIFNIKMPIDLNIAYTEYQNQS